MYDEIDIKLTTDGDLDILNGDFETVSGDECIAQDILDRLRSNDPDFYFHRQICANFEDIKGDPNTKDTGQRIEEMASKALTIDKRVLQQDLKLKAIPISLDKICLHAFLNTGSGRTLTVTHDIKL